MSLEHIFILGYLLIVILAFLTILKVNKSYQKTKYQRAIDDSTKSAKYLLSTVIIMIMTVSFWNALGTNVIEHFRIQFYNSYQGRLSDYFYLIYVWLIPLYFSLIRKNKSLAFKEIAEIKTLIFWPTVVCWLYFGIKIVAGLSPFDDLVTTLLLSVFYLAGSWFSFVELFMKKS